MGMTVKRSSCSQNLDLSLHFPSLSLLERAVARAQHHGLSVRTIHRLRLALVTQAQGVPDIPRFVTHVRPLIDQLDRDSGLAIYRELSHLPPDERLMQALAKADALYKSTPEQDRGYSVAEAIPELARVAMAFHGVGLASFDIELWSPLPSLDAVRRAFAGAGPGRALRRSGQGLGPRPVSPVRRHLSRAARSRRAAGRRWTDRVGARARPGRSAPAARHALRRDRCSRTRGPCPGARRGSPDARERVARAPVHAPQPRRRSRSPALHAARGGTAAAGRWRAARARIDVRDRADDVGARG